MNDYNIIESLLTFPLVLNYVEEIVVFSVPLIQSFFYQLFKLRLCLFFTHVQEHGLDEVLYIFLLQLRDISNQHQLEQINENICAFTKNLEGFATFNTELFIRYFLNL